MASVKGATRVATGALNLYFIYKFLRILTTKWEDTEAFQLKIIDDKGNILKKKRTLKTHDEKMSYTMMHRLVWKLKRLMEKVPFGKSRLASYATALWLIKEGKDFKGSDEDLQESVLSFFESDWEQEATLLKEEHDKYMNKKSFTKFMIERALTPAEEKKKEAMVVKLKKNMTDLEDRYGDQATAVMHGIATKVAKGEDVEIDEVKSKYDKEIAAFKKKGGKVKKLKPSKAFKSLFKQKGAKKPPRKEEIEATRMPMSAPFVLDEKEDEVDEKHGGFHLKKGQKFKLKQFKQAKPKKASSKKRSSSRSTEFAFGISRKGGGGAGSGYGKRGGMMFNSENIEEAKTKLPPHLAKFFDKDGNLKPEVAARVAKGKEKVNWIDVTPKGYGPKEEVEIDEIAPWKKGKYKVTDGKTGKVLGTFNSGEKAQKYVDKIWDKGDYDSLTVELGEKIVYTRGVEIDEEVAPHAKVMAKRGDSPEEIKKMHPEITEDELEKLYEHCGICGEKGYGQFKLELEAVDSEDEVDEMRMSNAAKKKKAKWAKSSGGKKSLKKSAKRAKKVARGSIKINKARGKAMARARKKGGIRNEFEVENESYPEGTEEYLNHCKEVTPGETKKVSEELSDVVTFSDYIIEGRSKLTPAQQHDADGVQTGDKAKMRFLDTQQKAYSLKDIQSLAKKHKVHLDMIEPPSGGTRDWDFEWQIPIRGGITLEYKPKSNEFQIKGWRVDKKKLKAWQDKYMPAGGRLDDNILSGGRVIGRGFETAFELIGEEYIVEDAKMAKQSDDQLKKLYKDAKAKDQSSPANKHFTKRIEKEMKRRGINEEAPTNNVGSGNVDLTPHKKKKKYKPEEFGGHKVFVVSSQRFWDSRLGKSRYARYEKYVGNDEIGETIREFGRANPKSPIILKNSDTGAMLYLKYGKRG